MTSASACVDAPLHLDTRPVRRSPFGSERGFDHLGRCGDCGVVPGAFHHRGCDVERCPLCTRQLSSCWCEFDEAELEDDGGPIDVDALLAHLVDAGEGPPAGAALPLASVIAPLRARHEVELRQLAGVGGSRASDDRVVLAVSALHGHREVDGRLRLRRPEVVAAVHRVGFLLQDHGIEPIGGVPEAIAVVLGWESDSGLSDRADPVHALLEPLHAHFGVGDSPSAHLCQCFAPHDPWCPPDHRLLPVRSGHLVHARLPDPLDQTVAPSALAALVESTTRGRPGAPRPTLPALDLLGSFVGSRRTGRLWVFGDAERPGRYDALHLDGGGTPWVARADRRCREGYRWCRVTPSEVGRRICDDHQQHPTAVA